MSSFKSFSIVQSLKPEIEFELLTLILTREKCLHKLLSKVNEKKTIDIDIVNNIELMRQVNIDVITTLQQWEQSQIDYPITIKPFLWNNLNYIDKIHNDCLTIGRNQYINDWLGFNGGSNPFFVPLKALSFDFSLTNSSAIIIGREENKYESFVSQDILIKIKKCWAHIKHKFIVESNELISTGVIRLVDIPIDEKADVNVWTPQDIVLQKTVQKKGGELSIITTAGTKGRIKAPHRKSRFERLEYDIILLSEQLENIYFSIEDNSISHNDLIELQDLQSKLTLTIESNKYQLKQYQRISRDNITSVSRSIIMKKLAEGETLQQDEKLSIELEEAMSRKIQKKLRSKHNKAMLTALFKLRKNAACKIQSIYRRYKASSNTQWYIQGRKLAIYIQTLYRSRRARRVLAELRRQALILASVIVIQRIYRGYIGRIRYTLKKEFLLNIKYSNDVVSYNEFFPSHLESLADEIERFVQNYSLTLPPIILTTIRGIMYVLNGDSSDSVLVYKAGYIKQVYLYANSLSWSSAQQVLRRKGRLLRRIRALARSLKAANPLRLSLSSDCLSHLKAMSEFDILNYLSKQVISSNMSELSIQCVEKMYRYCLYIYRVHSLQNYFPEYFIFALPAWFRKMQSLKFQYEQVNLQLQYLSICQQSIDKKRRACLSNGRKLGPILQSFYNINSAYNETLERFKSLKESLDKYIHEITSKERITLSVNENLLRARVLSTQVAKKELNDFLQLNEVSSNNYLRRLKELQYNIDRKTLNQIDSQAIIELLQIEFKQNEYLRNFTINPKHYKPLIDSFGELLSDLMIIQQIWREFLKDIGGFQYGNDLEGQQRNFYLKIKNNIITIMNNRKLTLQRFDSILHNDFDRIDKIAYEMKKNTLANYWDSCTSIQSTAEEIENRECAYRDAELMKQRNQYYINDVDIPQSPYQPILLLVDYLLPDKTKKEIVDKLQSFRFKTCNKSFSDVSIYLDIQNHFDSRFNVIVFVDKGIHMLAHKYFINILKSINTALSPRPRIVSIDFILNMHIEPWASNYSINKEKIFESNVENSRDVLISLGKARQMSLLLRQCLVYETINDERNHKVAFHIPAYYRKRFQHDFYRLIHELEVTLDKYQDLRNPSIQSTTNLFRDPSLVLITCIGCLLSIWDAPLFDWNDRHVYNACQRFLDITLDRFVELIYLTDLIKCDFNSVYRCKQIRKLGSIWKIYLSMHYNDVPARWALANWCSSIIELIESSAINGGLNIPDESIEFKALSYSSIPVRWTEDIYSHDFIDEFIGRLLNTCLSGYEVTTKDNYLIKMKYNANPMNSTSELVHQTKELSRNITVYFHGSNIYVSIRNKFKNSNRVRYQFKLLSIDEFMKISHPTALEIYEGRIQIFSILTKQNTSSSIKSIEIDGQWFDLLLQWIYFNTIYPIHQLEIFRSRQMLLSKFGKINGYTCRFEVFEENYCEIVVYVYGLLKSDKAVQFIMNDDIFNELIRISDVNDEKPKIETKDIFSIASIVSDRLEIKPNNNWTSFLSFNGLSLSTALRRKPYTFQPVCRMNRGPGRCIGSTIVIIASVKLVLTLFELTLDSDIYTLRLIIYDPRSADSIEYRLSPMERRLLFTYDLPLLNQIVSKLRVTYCNVKEHTRKLLVISKQPRKNSSSIESMVNQLKYDIYDNRVYSVIPKTESDLYFEKLSVDSPMSDIVDKSLEDGSYNYMANVFQSQSSATNVGDPMKSYWAWAIYLHRAIVTETIGTTMISITFNTLLRGFSVIVFDLVSCFECYRFINLQEACGLFFNNNPPNIEKCILSLSEQIMYELVDELMSCVEIVDEECQSNDCYIQLTSICRDESKRKDVFLAKLNRVALNDVEMSDRFANKKKIAKRFVYIDVQDISDKSVELVLRFNYNAIKDIDNSNNKSIYLITLSVYRDLSKCILDLIVNDTTGEIGRQTISGPDLMNFLLSNQLSEFNIQTIKIKAKGRVSESSTDVFVDYADDDKSSSAPSNVSKAIGFLSNVLVPTSFIPKPKKRKKLSDVKFKDDVKLHSIIESGSERSDITDINRNRQFERSISRQSRSPTPPRGPRATLFYQSKDKSLDSSSNYNDKDSDLTSSDEENHSISSLNITNNDIVDELPDTLVDDSSIEELSIDESIETFDNRNLISLNQQNQIINIIPDELTNYQRIDIYLARIVGFPPSDAFPCFRHIFIQVKLDGYIVSKSDIFTDSIIDNEIVSLFNETISFPIPNNLVTYLHNYLDMERKTSGHSYQNNNNLSNHSLLFEIINPLYNGCLADFEIAGNQLRVFLEGNRYSTIRLEIRFHFNEILRCIKGLIDRQIAREKQVEIEIEKSIDSNDHHAKKSVIPPINFANLGRRVKAPVIDTNVIREHVVNYALYKDPPIILPSTSQLEKLRALFELKGHINVNAGKYIQPLKKKRYELSIHSVMLKNSSIDCAALYCKVLFNNKILQSISIPKLSNPMTNELVYQLQTPELVQLVLLGDRTLSDCRLEIQIYKQIDSHITSEADSLLTRSSSMYLFNKVIEFKDLMRMFPLYIYSEPNGNSYTIDIYSTIQLNGKILYLGEDEAVSIDDVIQYKQLSISSLYTSMSPINFSQNISPTHCSLHISFIRNLPTISDYQFFYLSIYVNGRLANRSLPHPLTYPTIKFRKDDLFDFYLPRGHTIDLSYLDIYLIGVKDSNITFRQDDRRGYVDVYKDLDLDRGIVIGTIHIANRDLFHLTNRSIKKHFNGKVGREREKLIKHKFTMFGSHSQVDAYSELRGYIDKDVSDRTVSKTNILYKIDEAIDRTSIIRSTSRRRVHLSLTGLKFHKNLKWSIESISCELRWNGQCIYYLPIETINELATNSLDVDELSIRYKYGFHLPNGFDLVDCCLDMLFWEDKSTTTSESYKAIVGSISLSGVELCKYCSTLKPADMPWIQLRSPVYLPDSVDISNEIKLQIRFYIKESSLPSKPSPPSSYRPNNSSLNIPWVFVESLVTNEENWHINHVVDNNTTSTRSQESVTSNFELSDSLSNTQVADVSIDKIIISSIGVNDNRRRNHIPLELPLIDEVAATAKIDDDGRVCWRSRIIPKFANQSIKQEFTSSKSVFMSRSSRLIHLSNIFEVKVGSQISYLTKEVYSKENQNHDEDSSRLLPIVVKEVSSEGPGIVKRLYRIEIFANNGSKIGYVDINDETKELIDIIGHKNLSIISDPTSKQLLERDQWTMPDVFLHIVRERIQLEMSTNNSILQHIRSCKINYNDKSINKSIEIKQKSMSLTLLRDSQLNIDEMITSKPITKSPIKPNESLKLSTIHWIRLCSQQTKLSGKKLQVIVLLQSYDPLISTNLESFLKSYRSSFELLNETILIVRCYDKAKRSCYEFSIAGKSFLNYLHKDAHTYVDLSNKVRRHSFGLFIIQYLTLNYLSENQIKSNKNKCDFTVNLNINSLQKLSLQSSV